MLNMESVSKRFNGTDVLRNVGLCVAKGESIALIGPSGSGKTTLIRTVNGFVIPDEGKVVVGGREINYRDKEKLRQMRKKIGVIYQLFSLVERTTAIDNVISGVLGKMDSGMNLVASTAGLFGKEIREKATDMLSFVGIAEKAHVRVDRLSGGQKQRVAIARALMQDPEILLADEPIANLDPKTGRKILDLFSRINSEKGITIITVLHHLEAVRENFKRVVALKDGSVCFDGMVSDLTRDHVDFVYGFNEEVECRAA